MFSRKMLFNEMMFVLVFLLASITVKADVTCIGNDYEQQMPLPNVTLPSFKKVDIPTSVQTGKTFLLEAEALVDDGGSPFFVWCVESGSLEYEPSSSNYNIVKFTPSASSIGEAINIGVQVGDGLGYVKTEIITVNVTGGSLTDFDKSTGDITISSTDPDVDLTTPGTITLDGKPIQANWTSDGVTFNLYNATGKTFDTFWHPVKLEIHDANGQEIYSGCYPFKDVCPGRWYTRPVMKLWKEGIIEGYGDGKSGIFGTYNPALRAELVAATVRAKELGNTFTPLTTSPFADVKIDDWFAAYVQYAKDTGLIQGCDTKKNLFCPGDSISRAAAVKVIVTAFLTDTLTQFKNGKKPPRMFLDVTDSNDWFYHYIYAAEFKNVADGYSNGNFEPGQDLTRAEMAKMICIATFGSMECAEMGATSRPFIFAVTPEIAKLNEPTVFTVVGKNLSNAITFELADCANITAIAGGTAEELLFQCTPSNTGGVKNGTLRYNEGHTVFTVNVSEQVVPKVTSVTPMTATLNQLTTFTVVGSDLPDDLAFWIANCAGVNAISRTSTQQQFQCTPGATGSQEAVVKDASGANKLKVFFVDVVAPVTEPPVEPPPPTEPPVVEPPVVEPPVVEPPVVEPPVVEEPPVTEEPPPDTSCTPKVDSVSPLTATIDEPITFTVYGSCLPETTAFFVGECDNMDFLGGSETEREFRCTPMYSPGVKNDGVVKDERLGEVLFNFSVEVEWGTPRVTSVTPTSANFNEPTDFTVKGTSLTNDTILWIGECEGMEALGRLAEEQTFRCTPQTTPGTKSGVVKDKPRDLGGVELHSFTVEVN